MEHMVPLHPPDTPPSTAHKFLSHATAGQQAAGRLLSKAIDERRPIILLFGETGVGKSTLLRSVLATQDSANTVALYLSATDGELVSPLTFDALLDAICQRIESQPGRERPAVLAALTSAVATFGRAGRTIVLIIDHADHLTDKVMSELIRLPEYLDAAPESFVRIFIGSPGLASRLDLALRKPGAVDRSFVEIRVSQPTAEEVATLLAYEDMAQPSGPMLTPGAISRISAYAKSNLHWAVPLADAARALAFHQGEREVTPELVGGALLELWPPGQQQAGLAADAGSSPAGLQGLSDSAVVSLSATADHLAARAGPASSQADQPFKSASTTGHAAQKARLLRWSWIAVAASVLAVIIGIFTLLDKDAGKATLNEQPGGATERSWTEPNAQQPDENVSRASKEEGSGQKMPIQDAAPPSVDESSDDGADEQPAATPASRPVQPAPSSDTKPLAKKAAEKLKVKRIEESPSNQWIQTR